MTSIRLRVRARLAGLTIAVALLVATGQFPAFSDAKELGPCETDPAYRTLDFWLGNWEVQVQGVRVGTNRIEQILRGCAILEHWTDAEGREGKSLFYLAPGSGGWRQVWVTERATIPRGVKEKRLVESGAEGLRFLGRIQLEGGGSYLDRTTLVPLPEGSVRQVIEVSRDEGESWETTFDAVYVPARAGCGNGLSP